MPRYANAVRSAVRTLLAATVPMSGCVGIQSTFSTFGAEAESTRLLTLAMAAAAAVITVGVLWIARHAVRAPEGRLDHDGGMRVILWLGAIGPTVLLTLLLVLALPKMRPLSPASDNVDVAVEGKQFWWRVRYQPAGQSPVETANEIRVPIDRTVSFTLESPDVIHSFWIPGLAGKMDMIPGRTTRLVVRATRTGVFRGVCAELCGLGHALMAFDVVAMEQADFDAWLKSLAAPAAAVDGPGRKLFEEYGCPACHVIDGHFAGSSIGPDLTHMGSRRSLAAGALPMTQEAIARFIRDPAAIKPGALMPAFETMPAEDAQAVASYLVTLR